MGNLLIQQKEFDAGIEYLQKSLDSDRLRQQLDPSDTRAQTDVAISLSNLATAFMRLSRIDESVPLLEEATNIYRQFYAGNPGDARAQRNYFVLLSQLGAALRRTGQFDLARKFNEESMQLAKEAVERSPQNVARQLDLVTVLHARGVIEDSDKKYAAAIEWYEQALSIIAQLEASEQLVGRDIEWRIDLEDSIRESQTKLEALLPL